MENGILGLVAAMPNEINPLLGRVGAYTREKINGFEAYRFSIGAREIVLVRSGMGPENAAAATHALIDAVSPDMIVNFGFAGAVTEGIAVGDIIVAERVLLNREGLFSLQPGIDDGKAAELAVQLENAFQGNDFRVRTGTFITAARIKSKLEIAGLIPAGVKNPVLEMETAALAMAAAKRNVPLIAIRAVSDDAGEELGFTIEELTDGKMNIKIGKVFLTLARKPWIVPQMLRLAKNSRKAGKNLAVVIAATLETLQVRKM